METIKNKRSEVILNEETFNKVTSTIQNKVIKEDWRVTGDLNSLPSLLSNSLKLQENKSKKKQKKMKKVIYDVLNKCTLRNINKLLYIFGVKDKVKITISAKEEAIQKKRKEWLELRNEALKALAEYKAEKGDYYKNKLKLAA